MSDGIRLEWASHKLNSNAFARACMEVVSGASFYNDSNDVFRLRLRALLADRV
jgi:hypothetical protein